jgi:UDP-N-acetylglucosamine 2-epimerase
MQAPCLRTQILERGFTHILVQTGQHYDYALSQGQCDDLDLGRPDYDLAVGSNSHGAATGRMIERIEGLLADIRPDIVVVDGDTNSTLAAAIAVAKTPVPLVHVEAGVRDFERACPEEINRTLADHAADLNCAPIRRALDNLVRENLGARSVLTGDLLLDCLCQNENRADGTILKELLLKSGRFHLMTLHRPENTDLIKYERFCDIMSVVSQLDLPVIWPVHPRVEPVLKKYADQGKPLGAVRLVAPLTYLRLLALLQNCEMVLTDSGGLPREAVWSGKKCIVLYGSDLWPDLIEQGWVKRGGSNRASIEKAVREAVVADAHAAREFFGGGQAAQKVVEAIQARFYDEATRSVRSEKSRIGGDRIALA